MKAVRALSPLLVVLLAACASAPGDDKWKLVEVRNVYRDGSEAVPSELDGCIYLGRVSASFPEMSGNQVALNDPSVLIETLQKQTAAKGGNVLLYYLPPGEMHFRDSSLSGKAFQCSAQRQ